ncbi:MAG: hypothetical protein LBE34_10630 [Flavobacteriaceae bacterium]|jgi:hypothetical protein|nr:hypothetical protein [Flavobacteriaceae bacterium]
MKKSLVIAAFAVFVGVSHAQVSSRSTSFGLNLGGAVSVFFEDNTTLGLNNTQYKRIDDCKRRYESDYDNWAKNKRYSDYELRRKREDMVRGIRIEIENILTIEQRDRWYAYDDRYDRRNYHEHDYKHEKKKHKHKRGKGHGHGHHCD